MQDHVRRRATGILIIQGGDEYMIFCPNLRATFLFDVAHTHGGGQYTERQKSLDQDATEVTGTYEHKTFFGEQGCTCHLCINEY
jgi:ribosomal protein L2